MSAPPPSALSLGNQLKLRPDDSVLLTESSGTASASIVVFRQGVTSGNGQPLTIGAGCGVVIDGHRVGAILLTAGAVNYLWGVAEVPALPGGANVPVTIQAVDYGVLPIHIFDPTGTGVYPVAYLSGVAPMTGMWRGYAVAMAAGEVTLNGVILGSAAGALQAFPFVIYVAKGDTATLANCNIVGGGISL